MELKDFIKDVIVDIYEGISAAKKTTGKRIIPEASLIPESIPYVKNGIGPNSQATMVSNLVFEVSLTNENKDGTSSGIGVLLGSFNIGGKESSENQQTSLSKIKFNIPIELK